MEIEKAKNKASHISQLLAQISKERGDLINSLDKMTLVKIIKNDLQTNHLQQNTLSVPLPGIIKKSDRSSSL